MTSQNFKATRDGFGQALLVLAKKNPAVVVLTADLAESTRVDKFANQYPQRFIDVGVAEQNLAGVSAGLALSGKIPFMTSYAVFSPGRNWEQIRVSICYNNLPVKIISSHAGLNVGPDGATHQALEDIALTRVLPNMTVVVPADYHQAYQATLAIAKISGPVYLRLERAPSAVFTSLKNKFKIGQADVLHTGSDVALIACGSMVYSALLAAQELKKQGIAATVINSHTIKPLDQKTIVKWAQKTGAVVTIEEHQVAGGLGSAVAEILSTNCPTPQEFVAVADSFGQSGQPSELLRKYHLTVSNIMAKSKKVIKRKK